MTLLIVFLSVTNIALGYGLAIYMGHAQAPWAPDKQTANDRPAASGEKSRESLNDYTGTINQENDENNDETAVDAVAGTVAEIADELAEAVAEVEEDLVAKDEQETAASETVADEAVMQGIGEFQEQLKSHQERSKLHAVNDTSEEES